MKIINMEAYKAERREQWKKEVLERVEAELDKINPEHFETVAEKMIDYACIMSGVYFRTAKELKAMKEQERSYL